MVVEVGKTETDAFQPKRLHPELFRLVVRSSQQPKQELVFD